MVNSSAMGSPSAGGVWGGPPSGLTHRWPLDIASRSGTNDADIVGADTGTEVGTVALAVGPSGILNSSLDFDGSTEWVEVPSYNWNTSGSFSVGFWAWINDNTAVSPVGSNQVYFMNDFTGLSNNYLGFANIASSPGQVRVSCSLVGLLSPAGAVPSATWTHVLYTNNGGGPGGVMKLYINGLPVSTTPFNGDTSFATIHSYFANGLSNHNGALAGRLAQDVIYNRVLSEAEAIQLKNAH
jgi:hypothetical protein